MVGTNKHDPSIKQIQRSRFINARRQEGHILSSKGKISIPAKKKGQNKQRWKINPEGKRHSFGNKKVSSEGRPSILGRVFPLRLPKNRLERTGPMLCEQV